MSIIRELLKPLVWNPMSHTTPETPGLLQRAFDKAAHIHPNETRAVVLAMLYFFLLFGTYSVVKPVRDAMGTVYGMSHIQELFTGTFLVSLLVAPLYSGLVSRIRLSTFLPWMYGFISITIVFFYFVFQSGAHDRWAAASFYVWVSTFNILTISVFWSFMADTFSRVQAKRLFGFVAAGGTLGGIAGPAVATALAKTVGNNGLVLICATGFALTAGVVVLLAREKERLRAIDMEVQHTPLGHRLLGSPFDDSKLLFQSRYLLLISLFQLLMTWISTIVYIQLGDHITKAFSDRAARTRAYAEIDLTVNTLTVFLQIFGTGRIIKRFGVTTGLLVNPVIMVLAFLTMVLSVLLVLGGIQVTRRVAEYAVAKPTREMLFYRRRPAQSLQGQERGRHRGLSVRGLEAVFGVLVSAVWFPIAYLLGRRYEKVRNGEAAGLEVVMAATRTESI
jgi:AAA family ATP:ADP antiporter